MTTTQLCVTLRRTAQLRRSQTYIHDRRIRLLTLSVNVYLLCLSTLTNIVCKGVLTSSVNVDLHCLLVRVYISCQHRFTSAVNTGLHQASTGVDTGRQHGLTHHVNVVFFSETRQAFLSQRIACTRKSKKLANILSPVKRTLLKIKLRSFTKAVSILPLSLKTPCLHLTFLILKLALNWPCVPLDTGRDPWYAGPSRAGYTYTRSRRLLIPNTQRNCALNETAQLQMRDAHTQGVDSHGARQMRLAMSLFVYGIGPEHFEGKPFIDFRIPMSEEYE